MTDTSAEAVDKVATRIEGHARHLVAHWPARDIADAAALLRALLARAEAAEAEVARLTGSLEMAKLVQKIAWDEALKEAAELVEVEAWCSKDSEGLPDLIRAIPWARQDPAPTPPPPAAEAPGER